MIERWISHTFASTTVKHFEEWLLQKEMIVVVEIFANVMVLNFSIIDDFIYTFLV